MKIALVKKEIKIVTFFFFRRQKKGKFHFSLSNFLLLFEVQIKKSPAIRIRVCGRERECLHGCGVASHICTTFRFTHTHALSQPTWKKTKIQCHCQYHFLAPGTSLDSLSLPGRRCLFPDFRVNGFSRYLSSKVMHAMHICGYDAHCEPCTRKHIIYWQVVFSAMWLLASLIIS